MYRGAAGKLKEAARIFYARLPTDEELDQTGYTREDFEEDCEVWPENWPAFKLFSSLQTQWQYQFNGKKNSRIGLNYVVVLDMIDRMKLPEQDSQLLFHDIQVMEFASIE